MNFRERQAPRAFVSPAKQENFCRFPPELLAILRPAAASLKKAPSPPLRSNQLSIRKKLPGEAPDSFSFDKALFLLGGVAVLHQLFQGDRQTGKPLNV